MEEGIVLDENAPAEELAPIAKAVNDLLVLPVAMRSRNRKGVRVEKGEVIDFEYTGPILEQVLEENRVIRTTPLTGACARVPVVVAPVRNRKGAVIAALGVVDVVGTVDLGALFADSPRVLEQIKSGEKPPKNSIREKKEEGIVISKDSSAEELAPLAKAVNDLLVIPVAMRSKNKKGVRVEKGEVVDFDYTGPILEQVLKENRVIQTIPTTGKYARVPVIVAPIRNRKEEVIAALGVVDVVGTVDLGAVFAESVHVKKYLF